MLFCLFFFLKEGRSIWLWCVRLPAPRARPVHECDSRMGDLRLLRAYADSGGSHRRGSVSPWARSSWAYLSGHHLIGVITFFAARFRSRPGCLDPRA